VYYLVEVTVPSQTPASDPQVTRIEVYPGMVTQEWFGFPPGCYGLAHIQVWHHGIQLWPFSPHESFHWDGYVYELTDRYPIDSEPYELVVKTWNEDDTYDHALTFAVEIEPAPLVAGTEGLAEVLRDLGILREAEEE
jgi:hypothetical protein